MVKQGSLSPSLILRVNAVSMAIFLLSFYVLSKERVSANTAQDGKKVSHSKERRSGKESIFCSHSEYYCCHSEEHLLRRRVSSFFLLYYSEQSEESLPCRHPELVSGSLFFEPSTFFLCHSERSEESRICGSTNKRKHIHFESKSLNHYNRKI
jgi:hypothetical protein